MSLAIAIDRRDLAAQAAEGKIFGGWLVPAVDVEVAVNGACSCRSEERQGSKVLAGSPQACLAPRCGTSATGSLLNAAFRGSWIVGVFDALVFGACAAVKGACDLRGGAQRRLNLY